MKIKFPPVHVLILLSIIVAFGCKKSKDPSDSRIDLTKDSIYLYAQQTYYWNTSLPSMTTFNPRKYTDLNNEVFDLTQYSKNPATGKPYEYDAQNPGYPKYSFLDDGSVASELGGAGTDFGFSVSYNSSNDLRIKYVYAGSGAAAQGLKRGYQITKLNNRTELSTTSQANIDFLIDAIFGSKANVTMTVKKPDGSTQDVTVTRVSYTINPILYTNVFTAGNKKVGYIVFNSFTTNAESLLTNAFSSFSSQGVSELIVDLRYNGGGSVETAELLSNLIAPASANGTTMYDTYFNQQMQNKTATILKNQKLTYQGQQYSYFDFDYSLAGNRVIFAKTGALSVNRVYFIVTGGTASASELTINNLKPVVDVKLIGRQTYGKPVGFFAIRIDKYDLYMPQFETKNQLGVGGYYTGMTVDKEDYDDVTKEFGDPTEKFLSYALTYASKGSFIATTNAKTPTISGNAEPAFTSAQLDKLTAQLNQTEFKGMVDFRLKPRK